MWGEEGGWIGVGEVAEYLWWSAECKMQLQNASRIAKLELFIACKTIKPFTKIGIEHLKA